MAVGPGVLDSWTRRSRRGALTLLAVVTVVVAGRPAPGQMGMGGMGGMGGGRFGGGFNAVGGISIDADGIVRNVDAKILDELSATRRKALAGGGPKQSKDGLRKVSLARLTKAVEAAAAGTAPLPADVALMGDELMKVPYALRLSRAALTNIKVNLTIALALKAAFLIAAIAGYATLWMAVLADTGASVIVVANALRLLRAD